MKMVKNIKIFFSETAEKKNNFIIVVPKKNVKLANKRNKIRRQIRAILLEKKIFFDKKIIIKYLEQNESPNFQKLKDCILTNIKKIKFKDK